jgi:hypothetical protein
MLVPADCSKNSYVLRSVEECDLTGQARMIGQRCYFDHAQPLS